MINPSCIIVSLSRFFLSSEQPKVSVLAINGNRATPFFVLIVPRNALVSTRIVRAKACVAGVFAARTFADIFFSIVECVVGPMVNFFARFAVCNLPVHVDFFPTLVPAESIETIRIQSRAPIERGHNFEIYGIHNRILPLGQRDKTPRFINRLNDFVSWHVAFHGRILSQGGA